MFVCSSTVVTLCGSSPCINGGNCVDTTGVVVCNCLDGFLGTFCEIGYYFSYTAILPFSFNK